MRHKALKLIKSISALVLLVSSLAVHAGYENDDYSYDRDDRREIQSIQDLLPEVNNLNCKTSCDGAPGCGDYKDMESCLEQSETNGCFWSCD